MGFLHLLETVTVVDTNVKKNEILEFSDCIKVKESYSFLNILLVVAFCITIRNLIVDFKNVLKSLHSQFP